MLTWHTQATGITLSEVRILATAFTDWEGTCLAHHGIKGQKWGVRRFQNPDGTLTAAGKKHEQKQFYKEVKRETKLARKANSVDRKRIADVSYEDRTPSARIDKRVFSTYKHYNKTKDSIRELADVGLKADKIVEKSNSYDNYVYNKYRNGKIPRNVQSKQQRLNANSKSAMDAYSGKAKSIANDLLGKYGKKKIVVDRVFGIGMKRKASSIVENALYRKAARIVSYEQEQEEKRKRKGG